MESLLDKAELMREKGRKWRKIRNIIALALLAAFIIWFGIQFYYPYAEGVKSGKLNAVVYEGFVFKTYEGKLLLDEIRPKAENEAGDEFVFSVSKKTLAEQLMKSGGKAVELRYKQYFSAIPLRGKSRYVVVEIINESE